MPIYLDPRKKPSAIKIHISTGAGVDIVWSDQHHSHYDFVYLRDQCPCAMCGDERRAKQVAPSSVAPALPNALPIFRPRPGARSAKTVGNYALQIEFTDGHATGIYSYDYLRSICPCEACAEAFRSAADDH
jgi:DUF971 family protein